MFDPMIMSKLSRLEAGGAGYMSNDSLVYDGKTEGTDLFGDGNLYVKISDKAIDLNTVTTVRLTNGTITVDFPKDMLPFTSDGPFQHLAQPSGIVLVISLGAEADGVEVGTYILSSGTDGVWVTRLNYETIHPIDPKYLPGVCLPVVDLTGCTSGEAITDEAVIAKLNSVLESPAIIVSAPLEGYVVDILLSRISASGEPLGFLGAFTGGNQIYSLGASCEDGAWAYTINVVVG